MLRKLADRGEPDLLNAPLHERWSHPKELVGRWVSRYGMERAVELMRWNNSVPPLGGCVQGGHPSSGKGRYLSDYSVFERTGSIPLESLPEGVYIQDEAAAVVGRAVSMLAEGRRVLEIGAAPGGKTHHIQSSAAGMVCVDGSPQRMRRWAENRARLRWNADLALVADGMNLPLRGSFDLVLVDAPCTNTGVYRRRPDARWKWSGEYLERMVSLQTGLLERGAELVSPRGILIYSTCSLEDEENMYRVRGFESSFPSFRRTEIPAPASLVCGGSVSIFPPDHLVDGHFAIAWRREN